MLFDQASDTGAGVFLIIKNYSGDVMNFEMAKDMAELDGIKVSLILFPAWKYDQCAQQQLFLAVALGRSDKLRLDRRPSQGRHCLDHS